MVSAPRLQRLIGTQEMDGRTAGMWLVPDLGLMVVRPHGAWCVMPCEWISASRWVERYADRQQLQQSRWQWLHRHGLDRAEFARRRDALQALGYALQRDPLQPWRGPVCG